MKLTAMFLILLASSMVLIGSSGNFREYESQRGVWVNIAQGNQSYVAYLCTENGYSNVVTVEQGESATFSALTIRNQLGETLGARIEGDYSSLPSGVDVNLESGWTVLLDQEEYSFEGNVSVAIDAPVGSYYVPVMLYGEWDKGDAGVSICPLKVNVVAPQVELTKTLIAGNTTVPIKTNQSWTMKIILTNNGEQNTFQVRDTIPPELKVNTGFTFASAGNLTFTSLPNNSTLVIWTVTVGEDSLEYLSLTVFTRMMCSECGCNCNHDNNCDCDHHNHNHCTQEFETAGNYTLNEGAELVGYGIKTPAIVVEAVEEENNCCHHCHCG